MVLKYELASIYRSVYNDTNGIESEAIHEQDPFIFLSQIASV